MLINLLFLLLLSFTNGGGEEDTECRKYSYRKPLCSASLWLTNDKNKFYYEHGCGCDGYSAISVGEWQLKGDTLELYHYSKRVAEPVKDILRAHKASHGDKMHVRIISKYGDTVKENFIPVLERRNKSTEEARIKYQAGAYHTDVTEYILDTATEEQVIEIERLSEIFGRDISFYTGGYNDFTIMLDLPSICLWGTTIAYDDRGIEKLLVSGDSLIALPVHPLSNNFHLDKE